MASSPSKTVRLLVGLSVGKEHRQDAITALEEGFERKLNEEGLFKAHLWSVGQAIRSLPWRVIGRVLQILYVIFKIGVYLFKA